MSFAKYAQLYRENGFFNGSKIKATITDPDFVGQEMILSKGTTILQTRTIPISMVTEFFTDESGALALSVDNGTKTLSANVNITNYRTYNVTVSGAVQDKTRDIYIDKNNITLDDEVSSDTVQVAWTGDKPTVTVNSSNPRIATATLDNNIVTVADAGNGIKGKTDITIRVASTSAYDEATATVKVEKTNGSIDKSWTGLKNIVEEEREAELCEVGDEYEVTLSNGVTMTYIIGAIDHDYDHQIIFVPKRYDYLDQTVFQRNGTPYDRYEQSSLCTYLNSTFFEMLPSDMQAVISEKTVQYATSSSQLVSYTKKIWLPREYEILGTTVRAYSKEREIYRIGILPCFNDKLITLSPTSGTDKIATCSPFASSGTNGQIVVAYGNNPYSTSAVYGGSELIRPFPCFHIIKDSN